MLEPRGNFKTYLILILGITLMTMLAGCGGGGGGGGSASSSSGGGVTAQDVEMEGGTFVFNTLPPDFFVPTLATVNQQINSSELFDPVNVNVFREDDQTQVLGNKLQVLAFDGFGMLRPVNPGGPLGRSIVLGDFDGTTGVDITVDKKVDTVASYNSNLREFHESIYTKLADVHNRYIACTGTPYELARWLRYYYGGETGSGAMISLATQSIPSEQPQYDDDWAVFTLNLKNQSVEQISQALVDLMFHEAPFLFSGLENEKSLEGPGIESQEITQNTDIYIRIYNLERLDRGSAWTPADTGSVFYNSESRVEIEIMAPTCDDVYENGSGNDSIATAVNIERLHDHGLIVHRNDADYFKVFLEEEEVFNLQVSYLHTYGNVRLRVFDPSEQEMSIVSHLQGVELASFTSVPETGYYTFCVENISGWDLMFYNLDVNSVGGSGFGEFPTNVEITPGTGGIGSNWPHNRINTSNQGATMVTVDWTSENIISGDKLEIDVRPFGGGTGVNVVHPLSGGEISAKQVVLNVGNTGGIANGDLTLKARFLNSSNVPKGAFTLAGDDLGDPDPVKDAAAVNVSLIQFDEDSGNAELDTDFTVTLTRSVPISQFLSSVSLQDVTNTPFNVSVTVTPNSGGNASVFSLNPDTDLTPGNEYQILINNATLEDNGQNQFDGDGGTPGSQSYASSVILATSGGALDPELLFVSRSVVKAGAIIVLTGNDLDEVLSIEFNGGYTPIPENSPGADGGYWEILSPTSIRLVLPEVDDSSQYNGDLTHTLVFNGSIDTGIELVYAQTSLPDGADLSDLQLLMNNDLGQNDPIVPQVDTFGSEEGSNSPFDCCTVIENGLSFALVASEFNITRFTVDDNGSLGGGNEHIMYEFDEITSSLNVSLVSPAVHPNPDTDMGYVIVNEDDFGGGTVYLLPGVWSDFVGAVSTLNLQSVGYLEHLAVSPAGDYLAVIGYNLSDEQKVWIVPLDPETGEALPGGAIVGVDLSQGDSLNPVSAFAVSFSPDGQGFYVCYANAPDSETDFNAYIDYFDLSGGLPSVPVNAYATNDGAQFDSRCFDDIYVRPDGACLYVLDYFWSLLIRIDIASGDPTDLTLAWEAGTDPEPDTIEIDPCTGLVFVGTDAAVMDTYLDDEFGEELILLDRFVPGSSSFRCRMVMSIESDGPSSTIQSPYHLIAPCEFGYNQYEIQETQILSEGIETESPAAHYPYLEDPGYIAQMAVHFRGTGLKHGSRFYDDEEVPNGFLWITIFDNASGAPMPRAGGWFTNPSTGTLVTGYSESAGGYFDDSTAGLPFWPGTFEIDASGLSFPIDLTVVDDATNPFVATRALTIHTLDVAGGSNHLWVGLGDCDDDLPRAFVTNYIDDNGLTDWDADVSLTGFSADFEDEHLIVRPEYADGTFLAAVAANVPNVVQFTALESFGNIPGLSRSSWPRIHKHVLWEDYNSMELEAPAFVDTVSKNFDLAAAFGNSVFDSGMEAFENFINAGTYFKETDPVSQFGVDSTFYDYTTFDLGNLQGFVTTTVVKPVGATQFDFELWAGSRRGEESYTILRNISNLTSTTMNILPMADLISPNDGSVESSLPFTIEFTNPMNDGIETQLSSAVVAQSGLFTVQRVTACCNAVWRVVVALDADDSADFPWPDNPADFDDAFGVQQGELYSFELNYDATDIAETPVIDVVNGVLFAFSEYEFNAATIFGSEGSRAQVVYNPSQVWTLTSTGSSAGPRAGHIAVTRYANQSSQVLLLGGNSGTNVEYYDWDTNSLTNSGSMSSDQSFGTGLELDAETSGNETDAYMFGGIDSDILATFEAVKHSFGSVTDPNNDEVRLRAPRAYAQGVPFWYEHLSPANENEHPHAFAVFGGVSNSMNFLPETVQSADMLEIFTSDHLMNLNGSQAPGNVDPAFINYVTGTGEVPLVSRQNFRAVLLSDYTENTSGSAPFNTTNIGRASFLLMGGIQVVDNDFELQFTLLDSVQLVIIDYSDAVNGTLSSTPGSQIDVYVYDLPELSKPRAFFSATPLWDAWQWEVGDSGPNDFLEFFTPTNSDFEDGYQILIAGGVDVYDFNNFYGSSEGICDTEVYYVDVETYSNSYSTAGPDMKAPRLGHEAVWVNGQVAIIGGAVETQDAAYSIYAVTAPSVEIFTPSSPLAYEGEFEVVDFMGQGRIFHTATLINQFGNPTSFQRILIAGGLDNGSIIEDANETAQVLLIID